MTPHRVTTGAFAAVVLAAVAAGSLPASAATTQHSVSRAAGFAGQLSQVAAATDGDLWAIGSQGNNTILLRRHSGNWSKVSSSIDPSAVAAGGSSVWIGGGRVAKAHDGYPPHDVPVIKMWHAGSWVSQKVHAADGDVYAIAASSATNAWAVGLLDDMADVHYETEHWDGTKWSAVPVPGSTTFSYVATSGPNNAWAVDEHNNVWQYDGTSWTRSLVHPKGIQLSGVATTSSSDAVVVGGATKAGTTSSYLAQYDGTRWKRITVPSPGSYSTLSGVAMDSAGAWAVGGSTSGHAADALILHRSGTTWKRQTTPIPTSESNGLASVAVRGKDAYAVGDRVTSSGETESTFVVNSTGAWKAASSAF